MRSTSCQYSMPPSKTNSWPHSLHVHSWPFASSHLLLKILVASRCSSSSSDRSFPSPHLGQVTQSDQFSVAVFVMSLSFLRNVSRRTRQSTRTLRNRPRHLSIPCAGARPVTSTLGLSVAVSPAQAFASACQSANDSLSAGI